ncbi:hypothetical protein G3I19_09845 [Streptomyces sp. SID10853]|uniref:hypothetical protein n=1 Tax=Streptomyces sp. SID10853 TaxID=2706028 RepID=UPI0013BEDDF3|nr:hypothetical protein [Streptomyces sp. SID10853]NDZ78822.1 hypothetical protein [Streptomyces sp. SID10853]
MAAAEAVVPHFRALASRPRGSRLVLALLAGVLALLGSGVLPPTAALADEGSDAPGLTAPASFRVAPYGGKPRPDREKHILISYDRGVPRGEENGSTLTMDVTDSSDVLRLKEYGNGCSGTDLRVVCHVGEAYDSWTDWAGALPRAAPASKPGDTGELHVSFRDARGDVSRVTTRVEVGGPVLALREQDTLRVASGKEHAVALGVRNTGELPADGFTVTATVDEGLAPVRRSRSCDYLSHGGATIVLCRFPGVRLEPGDEAHVDDWLVLGASRSLMYSSFRATVALLGSGADNGGLDGSSRSTAEPTPSGTSRRGTGATLVPRVGGARGGSGKYSEAKDVWTKVRIANHPDYALLSELSAADGGGRRLTVGLRNDGAGDPHGANGGGGATLVLTLPEGTDVRKEPMEEIDEDEFEPVCRHHESTYTCPLNAAAPGGSSTLDFEVRKGKGGAAGSGLAKAALRIGDTEADHADPDAANNTGTFDPFGPVSDEAGSGPGTVLVVGCVLGGCVVLAGSAVLWRRKR